MQSIRGAFLKIPSKALIAALMLADVTASFETTMIFAALKTLLQEFHDPAMVGWLISGYMLIAASAAAICGRLGDIYGRRRMLLIVLFVALLGSLVSAFSTTLPGLIAGRCMQGLAGAILPLSFGLLRQHLPREHTSTAIGLVSASNGFGAAAGLVVGGYLIDHFSWHWLFFASAAMCMLSMLCVRRYIPAAVAAGGTARVDWLGGVLFVPGLVLLMLGIQRISGPSGLDPMAAVWILAAVAVLWIWLRHELNLSDPLIDVRLLTQRRILLGNAGVAMLGIGTFQLTQVSSLLFQQPQWTGIGLGLTAMVAGFAKLPSHIFGMLGSATSGYLCNRTEPGRVIALGAGMVTAGWLLLIPFHAELWQVVVLVLVICTGMAIANVAVSNVIVAAAPPTRVSESAGLNAVVRSVGMGIGAQLVMMMLATSTVTGDGGLGTFPSREAFLLTFGAIAVTGGVLMLIGFMMPARTPAASGSMVTDP
jgi:MFS family permease